MENHEEGLLKEADTKFSIPRQSLSRLWAATKKQIEAGEAIQLQSKLRGRSYPKRLHIDLEMVASIELTKRSTIRKLASGLKISKSTVGRWVSMGLIKAHTSALKSDLKAPNKLLKLSFSLEALELDRIINKLKFRSMYNTIHIDEKWFYITKGTHRFYLTPGEAEPHRTCKSNKFIIKVMLMCAVCKHIFAHDGALTFDGKIGIFSFTQLVPAQRSSRNRPAWTLEVKSIQSITKEVIKECLIEQVIPAIHAKWPNSASKCIFIQQDNARPHIKDSDPEFRAAASTNGFDITLVHQPPNSPDTNVNDLGWFRAIQSIQTETVCTTVEQLVNIVVKSFEDLSPTSLNNAFLSLQGCMMEIMKVRGKNNYKIPHMNKRALIRQDRLPIDLEVSEELVRECITYLLEAGRVERITDLMNELGVPQL